MDLLDALFVIESIFFQKEFLGVILGAVLVANKYDMILAHEAFGDFFGRYSFQSVIFGDFLKDVLHLMIVWFSLNAHTAHTPSGTVW